MPKWLIALIALFAVYFPFAIWADRSYVSTTPKGKVVIQLLPPFEVHNRSAFIGINHVRPLDEFGDDPKIEGDAKSPVVIIEGVWQLSPGHTTFADVSHYGAGRFAHLKGVGIVFSSSDASDPNTNGRRYWAVLPEGAGP